MGTFRYTIGGDYDAGNDQQGYYFNLDNEESKITEFGLPDVSAIGVRSDPGSDSLFEYNGNVSYQLVDANSKFLYTNNTAFALNYKDVTQNLFLLGGELGDSVVAGSGDDTVAGQGGNDHLFGNAGNDVFIGGNGADFLDGGTGTNTAQYSGDYVNQVGVSVSLQSNTAFGADAEGDTFTNIQNLKGSDYNDVLAGDADANVLTGGSGDDTLRGLGGADTLDGGAGNDRLVINQASADANGVSGVTIHGGNNVDTLFLQGQNTFTFDNDANFDGIEKIYVADGAGLDLTGIEEGVKIISQSTLTTFDATRHDVTPNHITGTDASDRITGGKGSDYINGGAGHDVLKGGSAGKGIDAFADVHGGQGNDTVTGVGGNTNLYGDAGDDVLRAGTAKFDSQPSSTYLDGGTGDDKMFGNGGEDTFVFQKLFGRDNVYNFEFGKDHFDVSGLVSSIDQIYITQLNGGANALITFDGAGAGNKIIVHNVADHSISADDFVFTAAAPHDGSYMLPF